jgi:hypothetical protein
MPDVQIGASVLFAIAWGSLALFFVGAFAGTLLLERAYRLALAIFAIATVGGFTFSYLAGFSIGRFTALLPLVITAFAVTQYRDPRLQLVAQAAALGIYVLLAWVLAEQVHFWGIQFDLPICLITYAAALVFPPGRNPARA